MKTFQFLSKNRGFAIMLGAIAAVLLFIVGHDAQAAQGVTYATAAGAVALSAEEKEGLSEQEQKVVLAMKKSVSNMLEEARKGNVSKEEINQAISQMKKDLNDNEFKSLKDELKKLSDAAKAQGLTLAEIKNSGNGGAKVVTLHEEIKEKKADLVKAIKGTGTEEVELKANTLRASIATNQENVMLPGIGQLGRKKRSLYDIFPKIPVAPGNHSGVIFYIDWDEDTTVKAAAAVAEGAAFPESTATFKGYTMPLRKIGDTLPVSEEFFEDEQMAAAELELFLSTNVEDKIDEQIVNGNNTGQNLAGLVNQSPAYTAAASGITDANIYDLIIKVMEDITTNRGAKYQPDFVAMNIADINKLRLKKDSTNNYVFDRQDDRLQSLNIIEDNNVAANTLVVGDSRFARIYEMDGVVVSRGMVNAQFTSDMLTLKARKRIAFLIRNVDRTGFRKVTSISAALTTLATAP